MRARPLIGANCALPRALVVAALHDARATLASVPALPGSRRLAVYRRALSSVWAWEGRQPGGRRRTALLHAQTYLCAREEVA